MHSEKKKPLARSLLEFPRKHYAVFHRLLISVVSCLINLVIFKSLKREMGSSFRIGESFIGTILISLFMIMFNVYKIIHGLFMFGELMPFVTEFFEPENNFTLGLLKVDDNEPGHLMKNIDEKKLKLHSDDDTEIDFYPKILGLELEDKQNKSRRTLQNSGVDSMPCNPSFGSWRENAPASDRFILVAFKVKEDQDTVDVDTVRILDQFELLYLSGIDPNNKRFKNLKFLLPKTKQKI